MAAIPGGGFKMGERGDNVTVAPFCLDVTEVTVSAFGTCVSSGACSSGVGTMFNDGKDLGKGACNWGVSGREKHPINCVNWDQATAYCGSVSKRLPSEEEWEWAARGGTEGRTYPWGNAEPDSRACWSGVSKRSGTCDVGSFAQGDNRWGIHDLAGNVWEWTSSKYDDTHRVTRGGGWSSGDAGDVRAAFHYGGVPSSRRGFLGFRCAR
jgi:formylglycine-generating enzyme required for sulfatase activity